MPRAEPPERPVVLIVHGTDAWYGSDRALLTLALELRERGLRPVAALATGRHEPDGPLRRNLAAAGVEVVDVKGGLLDREALRHPLTTAWATLRGALAVAAEARRRKAVVVANTILVAHLTLPSRLGGVPTVLWMREIPPMRWARLVTREVFARSARLVVAISEAVADEGLPGRRRADALVVTDAVLEPAAVAPEPPGSRPRIVVVGRLNPLREPGRALDALERVLARGHDAELHFVGDADTALHADHIAALRRRAGAPPLAGRVEFRGFVEDPAPIVAGASVVLNPRSVEPLGHVMFEAFRSGTPVVACSAGGPAEHIVDGRTGLLVSPGDGQAMGDAIVRLLDDPGLSERIAASAREACRDIDERVAAEHAELAERLRSLGEG